jgi:hypothetical protein
MPEHGRIWQDPADPTEKRDWDLPPQRPWRAGCRGCRSSRWVWRLGTDRCSRDPPGACRRVRETRLGRPVSNGGSVAGRVFIAIYRLDRPRTLTRLALPNTDRPLDAIGGLQDRGEAGGHGPRRRASPPHGQRRRRADGRRGTRRARHRARARRLLISCWSRAVHSGRARRGHASRACWASRCRVEPLSRPGLARAWRTAGARRLCESKREEGECARC